MSADCRLSVNNHRLTAPNLFPMSMSIINLLPVLAIAWTDEEAIDEIDQWPYLYILHWPIVKMLTIFLLLLFDCSRNSNLKRNVFFHDISIFISHQKLVRIWTEAEKIRLFFYLFIFCGRNRKVECSAEHAIKDHSSEFMEVRLQSPVLDVFFASNGCYKFVVRTACVWPWRWNAAHTSAVHVDHLWDEWSWSYSNIFWWNIIGMFH